jgi:hypothetical protein
MGPFATGRAATALRIVLATNAVFNLVGSVILFAAPREMMGIFGLTLDESSRFLCYLLGAGSLGLATLSALGVLRPYPGTLAAAVSPNVVFHAATAIVGVVIFSQGFSSKVWVNVAIHTVFALALGITGLAFRSLIRTPHEVPRGTSNAPRTL